MLPLDGPRYMLDTSSLRRVDELQVERDQIERIWTGILSLVENGRAMTVEPVYGELERGAPDTYKRLRQYRTTPFMIRMTEQLRREDVKIVQELCKSFPKLCRHSQHNRQAADSWLIAAANTRNLTVVTEEGRGLQAIPKVCESLDIPCIALLDLVLREGLSSSGLP